MADSELVSLRSPLALYVHIPFCSRRCGYCDFTAFVDRGLAGAVVDGIIRQGEQALEALGHPALQTVYVGGGTPSVLPAELLRRLLARLRLWSSERTVETTVEANPESLDQGFIDVCAEHGVSRLSLGIQSFSDDLLAVLGRGARSADNRRALRLAAERWPGRMNLDLLAGIPGQSLERLRSDVREVVETGSGHVSLYSLTREPGTAYDRSLREGRILGLGEEAAEDLWLAGGGMLTEGGFRQYEVSNFARPGEESLHNLAYWHLSPYLGLGPSAVSTLPGGGTGVLRVRQSADLVRWLRSGQEEIEEIGARDFLFETMMVGLRLEDGVEERVLASRFGDPTLEGVARLWERIPEAIRAEGRLRLSDAGRLVLDRVLVDLMSRLEDLAVEPQLRWPEPVPPPGRLSASACQRAPDPIA